MKYDRPVRVLLQECAESLPAPFGRSDVLAWFAERYPGVATNTVSTQMAAATVDAGTSRPGAVFERVGRGQYRPAAREVGVRRGPEPATRPAVGVRASRPDVDVLLAGCVKTKVDRPAPARELYTSPLFRKRVAYAEASGRPWFVISSRWGLVGPDERIAPYDLYLGDTPPAYWAAWATFVVGQLALHVPVRGAVVEVHAGRTYLDPLEVALHEAGATVYAPVTVSSMGETLAWYDSHQPERAVESAVSVGPGVDRPDVEAALRQLQDSSAGMSPLELTASDARTLRRPGLYSWWVDGPGAADLSAGLGHPVEPGLIYAGLAGATRWPSGRASANTLWSRLVGMHLGRRAKFSTFRLSLAAALDVTAGTDIDEVALTTWMEDHLRVVPVPFDDADALGRLERDVLSQLDPPLNLQGMAPTAIRQHLRVARARLTT